MDRLNQLRGDVGGSRDSTLETSSLLGDAYMTANDSSKYFSLSEIDSSSAGSPSKDTAGDATADSSISQAERIISNLSPIPKKSELDSFKIGEQIEAANILSGGVNIFDDNENSYDGDELVIDDAATEGDDKSAELKIDESSEVAFEKTERLGDTSMEDVAAPSKETEVVLQIDGKNVDAIDIGNGLYLYRKDGEEELAAVQILDDDQQQPNIKFLKVRENAEGNLEVYEEIEIEVPKEVPTKEGKAAKNTAHIPVKDISKISEPTRNKDAEHKKLPAPKENILNEMELDVNKDNSLIESRTEVNLNGKMMKFSESRKSPLIGTFTPMTYHSTPNKEGIPLTKTMVDLQLHPNRHSENVKKTIEVHTDSCKQRLLETPTKSAKDTNENNKSFEPASLSLDKDLTNNVIVEDANQTGEEINKNTCNAVIDNKIDEVDARKVIQDKNINDNTLQDQQTKIFDKCNFESDVDDKTDIIETKISSQVLEPSSVTKVSQDTLDIKSSNNEDSEKALVTKTFTKETKINNDLFVNKSHDEIKDSSQMTSSEEIHNKYIESGDIISNEDIKTNSGTAKEKEIENKKNYKSKDIIIYNDNIIADSLNKPETIISESNVVLSHSDKSENNLKEIQNDFEHKDVTKVSPLKSKPVEALETSLKSIPNQEMKQVNKPLDILCSSTKTSSLNPEKKSENHLVQTLQTLPDNDKTKMTILSKDTTSQKKLEILTKVNTTKEVAATTPTSINPAEITSDTLLPQPKTAVSIFHNSPIEELNTVSEIKQNESECKKSLSKEVDPKIKTEFKTSKNETKLFGIENHSCKNPKIADVAELGKNENEHKKKPEILPKEFVKKVDAKLSQQEIISSKVVKDASKSNPNIESKNIDKGSFPPEPNCSVFMVKYSTPEKTEVQKKNELNPKSPVFNKNSKISMITSDIKNSNTSNVSNEVERSKNDVKKEPSKVFKVSVPKPTNNNKAAVPFGKWTEANRQEFLNKIKESKVPINTSNTKQLKQANDLNRRDVLKKIDSQRQSNIASTKVQELNILNKMKPVAFVSKSNSSQKEKIIDNRVPLAVSKAEEAPSITPSEKTSAPTKIVNKERPSGVIPVDMASTVSSTKKDPVHRKEINNQDLIDKTIEGIINRAVTAKLGSEDVKQDTESDKFQNASSYASVSLEEIESKMNELHGIPFVERPPHELPKVVERENKSSVLTDGSMEHKGSKIPKSLPLTKKILQKNERKVSNPIVAKVNEESDEEIIEHEPLTGDIGLNKNNLSVHASIKEKLHSQEPMSLKVNSDSKKEPIITENDFDKFARRNSITYENCLTVNFDGKEHHNVVQSVVEKEAITKKLSRNEIMLAESKAKSHKQLAVRHTNFTNKTPSTTKTMQDEDSYNKNYQSKVQIAYQTAMSAKRQQECPITIIEDKPVKVVFMDGSHEFVPHQLNVQGKELSPPKKSTIEWDNFTHSNSESLDSDILDVSSDSKSQDDMKFKSKHQRKQVLTPVEVPELELIEPSDIGIEVSPKKKRKIEENKPEKHSKSLVPKKSYLLNRSVITNDAPSISQDSTKTPLKESVNQQDVFVKHSDPISAIDNLVKAAELLETQSEAKHTLTLTDQNSRSQQNSPVKRGRGRPRKYPLPEPESDNKSPSPVKTPTPQKKPRLIDARIRKHESDSEEGELNSDGELVKENWTMGKINENIVCPICNKLFRSENVVFKHVKHCTGPSPNRSDSDKRSPRRMRQSQDLDWKSEGGKSDSMDVDDDFEVIKPTKKRKSKEKRHSSDEKSDDKTEVIVIEDTPVKDRDSPIRKRERLKLEQNKTTIKAKVQHGASSLVCEFCGKTFRQLSYLVNHRLQHKNTESKKSEKDVVQKSLFSCEVCKKEFRKLHHLVQHRIIHNPNPLRSSRKSSSEQNDNKTTKDVARVTEDQSAGFRCEPCDKSFRKLHHLVEHRETHDEINKKCNPVTSAVIDTSKPIPLHHCDVCKKTFKKLQHLIEHKEHHLETSSEKSDDKSVKSSLSTKDIIHECPLCYMVFPNEHSLNKHHIICQRKKKQSAAKQAKDIDENDTADVDDETDITEADDENSSVLEQKADSDTCVVIEDDTPIILEKQEPNTIEVTKPVEHKKEADHDRELKPVEVEIKLKLETETKTQTIDKHIKSNNKKDGHERTADKILAKPKKYVAPTTAPTEIIKIPDTPTPKKKLHVKDKIGATVTKRQKMTSVPTVDKVKTPDSSDDDEVRYMLNPDFQVEESSEGKLFMKVRAKKRSSLQIERPNSKDLMKRRISLQHPPKIPRLKAKPIPQVRKSVNTNTIGKKSKSIVPEESQPATDSDDSDVKYSFPEPVLKEMEKEAQKKAKRQKIVEKRKSLSTIAKRKSLGKMISVKQKVNPSPAKQIKKRSADAEHRCDCGQLFSSAALLSRHTSLAHTPPRIRRRRSPPPDNDAKLTLKRTEKPQETRKTIEPKKTGVTTRKSSVNSEVKSTSEARKTKSTPLGKTRRSNPHKGVPVPDKMRKLMEKTKK